MDIVLTWNYISKSLSYRYNHAIIHGLCVQGYFLLQKNEANQMTSFLNKL